VTAISVKPLSSALIALVPFICGSALAARPIPTPIGAGAKYLLPATKGKVERALPVGRLRCQSASGLRDEAHVELFAERLVLLLPKGIGIGPGCSYPVRTTQPTGVVQFAPSDHPTVGDLFAVWGQPLGPTSLAGFHGTVSAWVGGKRWHGAIASIPLTHHAEIVLELGGYIPPHTFFLFATS
jgi:hypothetical protein